MKKVYDKKNFLVYFKKYEVFFKIPTTKIQANLSDFLQIERVFVH